LYEAHGLVGVSIGRQHKIPIRQSGVNLDNFNILVPIDGAVLAIMQKQNRAKRNNPQGLPGIASLNWKDSSFVVIGLIGLSK
jgi:hypothetical protein